MIEPKMITHWLAQSASVSVTDREDVAALIDTYPYFVPTRYVAAAETQAQQAFAPEMLSNMQLYRGNWLLFHEFLTQAAAKRATEPLPQLERETPNTNELPPNTEMTAPETVEETIITEIEDLQIPAKEEPLAAVEPLPTADAAALELQDHQDTPMELSQEQLPTGIQDIATTEVPHITSVTEIQQQPEVNDTDGIPVHQNQKNDPLIQPIYTEDYFLHQGLHVSDTLPAENRQKQEDKSLMVVMSFSEWLLHFKAKGDREKEEKEDQKALKTMWQKEKLAAALEEENEEIPETVFEMAVNSITKEEDLASEPLAEILERQGKHDKAIEMYRKLSLRNPQKKAYFARKIEELQKEKGI